MRDLARILKVTATFASGPGDIKYDVNDDEPVEVESDDDIVTRDELADEFLFVAWFQQEVGIVQQLKTHLGGNELSSEWQADQFRITLNSETLVLPLSVDAHNTYIAISSLAYLLGDHFDFWLVKHLVEEDHHALLITTKAETEALKSNYSSKLSRYFSPLKLGHDYFCGIDIPYIEHEDHNPLFKEQSEAIAPLITRHREEIANEGTRLREVYKQRDAWEKKALQTLTPSNFDLAELSRMNTSFEQKTTAIK